METGEPKEGIFTVLKKKQLIIVDQHTLCFQTDSFQRAGVKKFANKFLIGRGISCVCAISAACVVQLCGETHHYIINILDLLNPAADRQSNRLY